MTALARCCPSFAVRLRTQDGPSECRSRPVAALLGRLVSATRTNRLSSRDGVLGSPDFNECVVRVVEMEKDKQDAVAAMSLTPHRDLARGST